MQTISKNARLSVKALVFGAAIVTGVNAFGMDKEKAQRDYQEAERAVLMIEKCANESLESNKLSTFSSCMSKAAGHEVEQTISKEEVIALPHFMLGQMLFVVDACRKAGNDREACVDRAMNYMRTVEQLSKRTQQDENFSNN